MTMPWQPYNDAAFQEAVRLLNSHHPVAIPTETVYGLAAKFDDLTAIKEVFRLKNRPLDNPLIIHISDISQLSKIVSQDISPFKKLMETFWPGPLTLVLKANVEAVPSEVRAGLDTVAVRMPNHPKALALINEVGPLVAPSANKSGYPSPTSAQHVRNDYNGLVFVLDGGKCVKGLESTILDVHQEGKQQILRPGVLGWKEFKAVGFEPIVNRDFPKSEVVRAPGMKHRHYAPLAKVEWVSGIEDIPSFSQKCLVLSVDSLSESEVLQLPKNVLFKDFSGNFDSFAAHIYAEFREADVLGITQVYILRWPVDENEPTQLALVNRIEKAVSRV
jgi:L-threonylcarbamoyladenylate synthase